MLIWEEMNVRVVNELPKTWDTFDLEGNKFLKWCWSCTHPGK